MQCFFDMVLRPAFPDLQVDIHEQAAEGDWVTARKTIRGTHRGELSSAYSVSTEPPCGVKQERP
jgi:predicted ester cyclase